MGFKNASAYFQREIDAALGGLRLTCCVVYIDDICVYSSGSLEDHLQKVKAVLRALRVIGFSGNPSKCFFAQKEVTFLGHRVSHGEIYALEDKVKCMMDYQRPSTLTELRGFLGLMSYYRRFIQGFAAIAAPLTELTKQPRSGKSQRELKADSGLSCKRANGPTSMAGHLRRSREPCLRDQYLHYLSTDENGDSPPTHPR